MTHRVLHSLIVPIAIVLSAAGCASPDDAAQSQAVDTQPTQSPLTSSAAQAEQATSTTAAPASSTATSAPTTTQAKEATAEAAETTTATTLPFDGPASCAQAAGVSSITINTGGAPHDLRIFVPDRLADDAIVPIVLNFHGFAQSGPEQAMFSDYEQTAAREGFIVAHPTGMPAPGGSDNAWELMEQDFDERDDAVLVDEIITLLVDNFCGDRSRVYATGFSNGGYFTSRLVCERSDAIAAAISVGALTHPDDCEPTRPVPYAAFHGTNDRVVPFDGGSNPNGGDLINQIIPDEFAEFAADFGCQPAPGITTLTDEVNRYDYLDCDEGVPVVFFEIVGGGHTWPGSPSAAFVAGEFGATTADISATDDGWAFLSQFSLDD